ncbi:hypothetical protein BS50DRAFT_584219 [Corynespora cassiicola Philippines]|uniref:DUF7730 domain-containing protein n=1 Tax=Corynespora cassiicola Philippines TaxID=1448308 RepID=A0A2T2NYX7_CORCC|nr:hypothetical protein BS50DRAFT_584219 [Corynespora cassiicola Philippines]
MQFLSPEAEVYAMTGGAYVLCIVTVVTAILGSLLLIPGHVARRIYEYFERLPSIELQMKQMEFPDVPVLVKSAPIPAERSEGTDTREQQLKKKAGYQGPSAQPQSRLLQLLAELRLMIYEHIFKGAKSIPIHRRCRIGRYDLVGYSCSKENSSLNSCNCQADLFGLENYPDLKYHTSLLPLLRVSRMIYHDVLYLIYGSFEFVFYSPHTFLLFAHSIPESHLQMIRSLRLDASKFKLLFGISFEDPLAFLPLPIREAHKYTARLTPASAESSFIRRAGRWYDAMPHTPSIWGAMCNKLVEMRGLRILRMNIIGEYFPGLISEPG